MEAADALLREFLRRHSGRNVYVDFCLKNPAARTLVESSRFRFQRSLNRMYRGPNTHPGTPQDGYGIAGPELG